MNFNVQAIENISDLDFVFAWCGLIVCGGQRTKATK